MKETFYFSHDYNASQDPKVLNMLSVMNWEGYGLFWLLIEKLAEANGKLCLNDLDGIAFACRVDKQKLVLLVNDFLLFSKDNTYFWSNRLLEHLRYREKSHNIRAKAGRSGGLASAKQRSSKAQAMLKQNQAKESKVKESKVKEINTQATPDIQVNFLLKEFEEINPTINYGNITQRKACSDLVEKFGYEKVIATLKYYKTIRGEKFSPVITTPYQLQQKIGELMNFYNKSTNNNPVII